MIQGIGMDLLEISRMQKIINSSSGNRFIQRVLTPLELELATARKGRLTEFVAGRFAAKEAVVKALGCGIGGIVGFQDMEVLPDSLGKPICSLSHASRLRLGLESSIRIHLSITHSDTMAAAYAIIES